jgi:hypothetical protein
MPTLEFNGIGGGYQGEGTKTVIPSRAFAKISCRLVANQNPARVRELVFKAVRERMPGDVTFELVEQHDAQAYVVVPPDRSNTPAGQSPALANAFRATDAAVREVFGRAPLYLREGGSVPIIADIKRVLGLDSVLLGLFLPEDNLHAPNESFHLGVMEKGIRAAERIYEGIARAGRKGTVVSNNRKTPRYFEWFCKPAFHAGSIQGDGSCLERSGGLQPPDEAKPRKKPLKALARFARPADTIRRSVASASLPGNSHHFELHPFQAAFQAGGLTDFSRWLSEAWRAIPPVLAIKENRIPEGCQMSRTFMSGTPSGCCVFNHAFRWCRSLRDLNHRLISFKPPA